jgi:PKD repeat protein
LQYKYKKNLYKIVFVTILLGFIISLVGCNWLSFGLLNILDPQAQMRLNYTEVDLGEGSISLEIYSLNEVEFIGSGFEYEYYNGTTKITSLDKMVGVTFYVEPSASTGAPGPITKIDNMPLYFQEVLDYLTLNPLVTELTCNITMVGTDGAGHSISETVTIDLPALQPGIDFVPPTAVINVTPGTTGTEPFTVIFDAYSSTDDRGIASYAWDFGDGTTATGVMPDPHTYTESGSYIVKLTVTDYFENEGIAFVTITVGEAGAPTAVINVTPGTSGTAPFEVIFDAYDSSVEPGCGTCSIVSYDWNFGDGDTDTGIITNHIYTDAGTYNVILTVTDSNGNTGYTSVTITVTEVEMPTAVINVTPSNSGIAPFTVYFDASESSGPTSIVSYDWNFGDTTTGTGITTNNTYSAAGTYVVVLTVTDSNNNEGYDSETINVYEAGAPYTITVTANPTEVDPGGGDSTITADVRDWEGNPVTTGTTVTFGTNFGSLVSTNVFTNAAGLATTTLTLSSEGIATVTATCVPVSDTVNVTCPPVPTP